MFGENKKREIYSSLINFCKTVYKPVMYGKKPCYIELLLMDSIFSKTPMGIGHAVIGVDIIEDSDSGKKVLMCKNSHGNKLAYRIYDLNYAKLSYRIGNSYENPSLILNDFLKRYPKNKESNYIQKLILESYLKRKNYGAALKVLNEYPKLEFREIRQKAFFMKAVSLFNRELYRESIDYFEQSLENNYSLKNSANSKYWISRALFEVGEFEKSLKIMLELS